MTPKLVAILNCTPDSFAEKNPTLHVATLVDRALAFIDAGADIIDVGGESTRPGASPVDVNEELKRVIPVITEIRRLSSIPISIDTSKYQVAKSALQAGATIINDVTAGLGDPFMLDLVSRAKVPVVLMHHRGTPQTMTGLATYKDVVSEVKEELLQMVNNALKKGVQSSQIILDLGIGFAKTTEHNLTLLNQLDQFKELGYPLFLGVSRKRFIGEVLGDVDVPSRLFGSVACSAYFVLKNIDYVRVHDVRETREVFTMLSAIKEPSQ